MYLKLASSSADSPVICQVAQAINYLALTLHIQSITYVLNIL